MAEEFGFWLDGRDGAERDELVAIEADAGIVIFEEFLGWRKDAAVAAPEILEDRRNDAVMHMPGENEIEFREFWLNGIIEQMDGGVDEHNFSLFL